MNASLITQIVEDCLNKLKYLSDNKNTGLRNELRSLLINALGNLNLVSRDDFEAQKLLLERTRDMVAVLDEKISRLEQKNGQASQP